MSAETHEAVVDELMFNDAWLTANNIFRRHHDETLIVSEGTYSYNSPIDHTNPTFVRFTHSTGAVPVGIPTHAFDLYVSAQGEEATLDYLHVYKDDGDGKAIRSNFLENIPSTRINSDLITSPVDLAELLSGLEVIDLAIQAEIPVNVIKISADEQQDTVGKIEAIIENYPKQVRKKLFQWSTDDSDFEITGIYDKATKKRSVQLSKTQSTRESGKVVTRSEAWTFRSDSQTPQYSADEQTEKNNVILFVRPVKNQRIDVTRSPASVHTELHAGMPNYSAKITEGLKILRAAA